MAKIWACIAAILLMISILSLNVSAINTDDTYNSAVDKEKSAWNSVKRKRYQLPKN